MKLMNTLYIKYIVFLLLCAGSGLIFISCSTDGTRSPDEIGDSEDDENKGDNLETDTECIPSEEGVELCDGIDNDCDGTIDEDFNFHIDPEHCGACNESCDLPNALTECREGRCIISSCSSGYIDEDQQVENGCEAEECIITNEGIEGCDSLDNDCDGTVDEDFDLQSNPEHCGTCNNLCELLHAEAGCNSGACIILNCDNGWFDEDRAADNGCESEDCTPINDGIELCNLIDDNCDGAIDEDFDLENDLGHCGVCLNECSFPQAIPVCSLGGCQIESCVGDWSNADGILDNGCELECAPTNDGVEICDGHDNDCDGVTDEEIEGDGLPCQIGDYITGSLRCTPEGLLCVPEENTSSDLCGTVSGVLTPDYSPYRVVCPELIVEPGSHFYLESDVEVLGIIDESNGTVPVIHVQGNFGGTGAELTNLRFEVSLGGTLELDQVHFFMDVQDNSLIKVESGVLVLEDVELGSLAPNNIGVFLISSEPGTIIEDSLLSGFEVAVMISEQGDLIIENTTFTDNRVGCELGSQSKVLIQDCRFEPSSNSVTTAIDAGNLLPDSEITLSDNVFGLTQNDILLNLDPDLFVLGQVQNNQLDGDELPLVILSGEVTGVAVVNPIASLQQLSLAGEFRIAENAALTLENFNHLSAPPGEGFFFNIFGALNLEGQSEGMLLLEDIGIQFQPGSSGVLERVRMTVTAASSFECLLVSNEGTVWLNSVTLYHGGTDTDLPRAGLCITGGTLERMEQVSAEHFQECAVIENFSGEELSGLTLNDCERGLVIRGDVLPEITGNTFQSPTVERQMVAIRLETGADPGGSIHNNIIDFDPADIFLFMDPDCFSDISPMVVTGNEFLRSNGSDILLGGTLESELATISTLSPGEIRDDFQLRTIEVAPESTLTFSSVGLLTTLTLRGLGNGLDSGIIRVYGSFVLNDENIIVTSVPIVFEPGSTGQIARATIQSPRDGVPLLWIRSADPVIAQNAKFRGRSQVPPTTVGIVIENENDEELILEIYGNEFSSMDCAVSLTTDGITISPNYNLYFDVDNELCMNQ